MLPYARQSISDDDVAAVEAALRSDWLTTGPRVRELEVALESGDGCPPCRRVQLGNGRAPRRRDRRRSRARRRGDHDDDDVRRDGQRDPLHGSCRTVRRRRRSTTDGPVASRVSRRRFGRRPGLSSPSTTPAIPRTTTRCGRAAGPDVTLIADASHSLGAIRGSRPVGTLADMTILSLHPAKIITTGEGGAVLTDRDDFDERLRRFRNHGISSELSSRADWHYEMVDLGFNYRLTDIGAALGTSQLSRLPEFLARRRELAARYLERLAGHAAVELPSVAGDARAGLASLRSSCSDSTGCPSTERRSTGRCGRRASASTSTTSRSTFIRTTARASPVSSLPVAEAAYERLLTLPLFPAMSDADLDDVVAALDKVTDGVPRGLRSDEDRRRRPGADGLDPPAGQGPRAHRRAADRPLDRGSRRGGSGSRPGRGRDDDRAGRRSARCAASGAQYRRPSGPAVRRPHPGVGGDREDGAEADFVVRAKPWPARLLNLGSPRKFRQFAVEAGRVFGKRRMANTFIH